MKLAWARCFTTGRAKRTLGVLRRRRGGAGGHRLSRRGRVLAPPRAAPGRLARNRRAARRGRQGSGAVDAGADRIRIRSEDAAPHRRQRAISWSKPTTWARCSCWPARALRRRSAPERVTTRARSPCSPRSARRAGWCRWKCRATTLAAMQRERPAGMADRSVRLRPPAARVLRALLHRAPPQPAQGRLPVPLHRLPGRAGAATPARASRSWSSTASRRSRRRSTTCIRDLDALAQAGVDVLRISPQSAHTLEIAALFRQCLERPVDTAAAARQIESLMPARACNGYWHGKPGLEQVVAQRLIDHVLSASDSTASPI